MPVLKALLTGQPRAYGDECATQPLKKRWETAIFKQARAGEVRANELGFEGDAVADTLHHGGEEKAIFLARRKITPCRRKSTLSSTSFQDTF